MLWGSVGEKCCREVAEKCVVGKSWRRSVVGKCCRDVLQKRFVEKCCREAL